MRGYKVMLSDHLASLYGVEARVLNQAVKRSLERFPEDFMFQLTIEEWEILKSQFVTSSWGGSRRAAPYAFTQEGVAMLSSVLASKRAIQVNIAIMRAFVKLREKLREMMGVHQELAHKIEALERQYQQHDLELQDVFEAIRTLLEPEVPSHGRRIGFQAG